MITRALFAGLLLFSASLITKAETPQYEASIDAFRLTTSNVVSFLTGAEFTRLEMPVSVASTGNYVYFFDAGLNGVYRYDRASQQAVTMNEPSARIASKDIDLFVNEFQELYVLDVAGGQVLRYDFQGNLTQVYRDPLNLNAPQAMCINPLNRHLFIADKYYSHVIEFGVGGNPVALHGLRVADNAGAGSHIIDMACGKESFYVVASLSKEVKRFTYQGQFIEGMSRNRVNRPSAMALDEKGRLYIADRYNDTINVFQDGTFVGAFGGSGSGPNGFRDIEDLWFDGPFLYVADSANRRIQVFIVRHYAAQGNQE
ncbi:MAG: 6-bladed beta-propeller [Hydrogenovibrio sp.]|uniref:6-bladed beta-propeller n=1 Tax=Hydrogenovibrio sp. TaxID=2065821 RepID=UPI0028704A1D|nr:6-bladed beta-propeller [Hydrogenovibrio sp.]MDR9499658.1 6-bladed beta-propeller [Hydrogenovibrio sp.]